MRITNPLKQKLGYYSKMALIGIVSANALLMGGCATLSSNTPAPAVSSASDIPFNGQYRMLNRQQTAQAIKLRGMLQQGQLDKMTQTLASQGAFRLIGQEQPDIYNPYQEAAYNSRAQGGFQSVADSMLNYHMNLNMRRANPGLSISELRIKMKTAFAGPYDFTVPMQLLAAGVDPSVVSVVASQSVEQLSESFNTTLARVELTSPYTPKQPTFWQKVKDAVVGDPAPQKVIQGL